jgi:transcriptional regulator GlxA family with amidase domain
MLWIFPNNAVAALDERPAPGTRAEPATVRRAVAFIDANAHRPIGLADIAEAARLSARGLRRAFRRYRGCTPLHYLRQVRLAGAHRDLQAGDPTRGDTVPIIAARWGFTHAGTFSADYRRIHGRSPSQTLHRAR